MTGRLTTSSRPSRRRRASALRSCAALLGANARYWSGVFWLVRRHLRRWEAAATTIGDPARRALAIEKLRSERFNVELAATFATLAPRARRALVVESNVALQVLYDYLDALGERSLPCRPDDGYAAELGETAERAFVRLPAARAVCETARRAARRCAQAQALYHAARGGCAAQLQRWAQSEAQDSGLGWQEWLAGAQASVLCLHALAAAAADARTTAEQAQRLDSLYLSIGALTTLDSLIDRGEDAASGERGLTRFYASPPRIGEALAGAARLAAAQADALPHRGHHKMTLAGVVAYYASAPSAATPPAPETIDRLRRELGPALAPTLALMRAWRAAKRRRSPERRPPVGRAPAGGGSMHGPTAAPSPAVGGLVHEPTAAPSPAGGGPWHGPSAAPRTDARRS